MKKSFFLIALLCAALSAISQPAIVTAKTIRATEKFTLDTANVTRIKRVVNVSSVHSQLPTAKAVWDAIQTGSPVLSVNGLTGSVVLDLNRSGQTLSLTGDASTVTLPIIGVSSGTGVSVSTVGGVATVTNTGDLSTANEIQSYAHSGTTSYTNTLSLGGGTFTLTSGSGIGINHSGGAVTVSNTGDLSTTNEIQTISRNVATNNVATLSLSGGTANVEDLFVESTASFTPGGTTATMSGTLPSENTKLWVTRNGLSYVVGTNVLRSGSTLTFSRALVSGEVVKYKYPFQ